MGEMFPVFQKRDLDSWIILFIFLQPFFHTVNRTAADQVNAVIDLFKFICNVEFGIITSHTGVN